MIAFSQGLKLYYFYNIKILKFISFICISYIILIKYFAFTAALDFCAQLESMLHKIVQQQLHFLVSAQKYATL